MCIRDSYYSLNTYLRQTFGEKVYRLSLNGGMTCPNRDGSIGTGAVSYTHLCHLTSLKKQ